MKSNWGNKYLQRREIYQDISETSQGYIGFHTWHEKIQREVQREDSLVYYFYIYMFIKSRQFREIKLFQGKSHYQHKSLVPFALSFHFP